VAVVTPGGTGTLTNGYTYVLPPNPQTIAPTFGTTDGGTAVTITGTAFQSGATVTIGGVSATGVSVTATSITATTPAHAAGATDVVVTNPDGQSGTLVGAFTFVGTLSIVSPASSFSYAATLTGNTLNLSSSSAVTVLDSRGTGAGWNLQGSIGTLTNAGGDVIPASGHQISSVATTGVTGVAPTNGITYPRQIPTSLAKVFNAAPSTGTGQSTETFTTALAVPADAASGTYSTTLTVTIASGP
jgi:hypothetical protein